MSPTKVSASLDTPEAVEQRRVPARSAPASSCSAPSALAPKRANVSPYIARASSARCTLTSASPVQIIAVATCSRRAGSSATGEPLEHLVAAIASPGRRAARRASSPFRRARTPPAPAARGRSASATSAQSSVRAATRRSRLACRRQTDRCSRRAHPERATVSAIAASRPGATSNTSQTLAACAD